MDKRNQSLQAPSSKKNLPQDGGLLIDIHQVAKLLKVSPHTVNQMKRVGEMPKAIRINRVVRWGLDEISAWIAVGCPPAEKWKGQ